MSTITNEELDAIYRRMLEESSKTTASPLSFWEDGRPVFPLWTTHPGDLELLLQEVAR